LETVVHKKVKSEGP